MTPNPVEETLDETRARLAVELPTHAAFDGWSKAAVSQAASALNINPDVAQLAFDGPVSMIDAWFASVDAAMLLALPPTTVATMKVREKITSLVEARLMIVSAHKEALRRALAILAFPTNALTASRLGWRAADMIWRAAGDTATDYNHYTKRAILSSVYAATVLVLVDDKSDDHADTRAFLERRIAGIMRFEKTKAKLLKTQDFAFSPLRFLGRLRYPA